MTEHQWHLDPETAERLLDSFSLTRATGAGPAEVPHAPIDEPVLQVLTAAAGPAKPAELAGEEAAVMAFRAERANGRRGVGWRGLLTFKIFAATAVVTAGGLAFASTTGILPTPFDDKPAPPTVTTPAAPPGSRVNPGGGVSGQTPTPSSTADAVGAKQIEQDCKNFLKDPDNWSKHLDQAGYDRLVAAAAGPEKVEAFCQRLEDKGKPERSAPPANGPPTSRPPR